MPGVLVIGNVADTAGRTAVDEVVGLLRGRGVDASGVVSEELDGVRSELADAVSAGVDRMVAVGGDGVVNVAINAVAQTDTVLGVVPHGTGNDFARALGLLDGSVEEQVDRALGEPIAVDALRTDHGWVATVATLGFSGDVTARANAIRWPRGQSKYTVATLAQLPNLRLLDLEVTVDDARFADTSTLLAVGNTAYFGGGMRICPEARPGDGRLHVVNIGGVSRRRFARVFPTVFRGHHLDRPEVASIAGSRVTIAARDGDAAGEAIELWGDGERLGPIPATIEVVPGALQIASAHP